MSESAVKTGKNGERAIGGAANRQKKSSFQITSVTATRMSNDAADDSADDLDESHTDDISRVTEGENETPSFSEDTFSKDDVFFNPGSTSLGSAPVIPTSSQYGLAIVTTNDSPTPGPESEINVKTEEPHVTTRNERFKVVKIESTEPFKRGRWQCMDYLDHSGYDEDNHSAEQSIQISTPKTAAQQQSQNAVPNPQPQSMPHQQIQQQVVPPAQGQTLPHSQPVNNGPVHTTSQPAPQVANMVPNMVPASQPPNMVPPSQPQQQPVPNMVPANQQMPNMVPASQPQQQMPTMVPTQTQVPNMVPAPTMVAAQQPMAPVSGVVSQPVSQVTNIVPQTQQIASSTVQSQNPQQQQMQQVPQMVPQSQPTQMQSQPAQISMGSQSQPQSLTTIPQALQQAGQQQQQQAQQQQQQLQQQLMQQQMQQQQMQYFPQTMHQGGGMMGLGHPMPQYPVQMPGGYGQPSYVPTMPQLLPQQMMPANFQNFQQQPTSSPSFPNSVTASGGLGYNQNNQPVMSYPNQGMGAYPQVMVPQMVPQPQPPAPQVPAQVQNQQQQQQQQPQDHASDLQVSVALLESLVEATANSEQVQGNEDAESLFPSRLAQALTAYRERLSAARIAQAAQSRAPSPSPSASGTSAVAIDNKIEQAMDLVKSHLMFAVREEVEVLREKISELMERINLLEMENAVLKSQATPETLASLAAQVSATSKPPGGPPN